MEALEQLKSVLCDPEGSVCISGSDGDRKVIADALEALGQQVAALVDERAKSAEQYVARLNQIDALTKERDELEISNAFAHGEWRAVKDQLAALTKERNIAKHNEQCTHEANKRILKELDAAQAREAKLRKLDPLDLAIMFHHTYERLAPNMEYDTRKETRIFDLESANGKLMVAVCADLLPKLTGVLPTDDSALQARLKQERERCAERLEAVDGEWITKVAASALIRSMT